jgi:hypothetical protein
MSQSSGTITALNGTVAFDVDRQSVAGINITGTWVAILVLEATVDDATWFSINAVNPQNTNIFSAFAQNLQLVVYCGGYSQIRIRASAFTSGTIQVASTISTGTNIGATIDSGIVSSTPPAYSAGAIAQLSLTTAGALRTQNLKDAGRTYLSFNVTAAAGVTSEALLSFSQNKQGTTTASVTSYTITNGKTLRITTISYSVKSAAAAIAFSRLALRHNTAGATTASSPIAYQCPEINTNSATSGTGAFTTVAIPDGIEFFGNGTQTIGMSHLDQATTNVLNVTLHGFEY